MGKVILICGKICSGKTHYCNSLMAASPAVLLSCDELINSLYKNGLGEKHDEILPRVKEFLLNKAAEIISVGCDVILDWGFWGKAERDSVSKFFSEKYIAYEWHYIDISYDDWTQNIESRNAAILAGISSAYYVDSGLLNKLDSLFEKPSTQEIDVWYNNRRII